MPRTHTAAYRVRYYECDAYGHLNNANYVRYMEEAAFDASEAAGYGRPRYAEMGRTWWVRASEIEYLRPLFYNDLVEVKTWVMDIRRATSRRAYEFSRAGKIVARGHSDWVFINTETGQPAAVPKEVVLGYFPEGRPAEHEPRPAFPAAPPAPEGVFKMRRKVAWRDLDSVRHVNNAVYFDYIEDCGFEVVAAHGWPVQRMTEAGFGILIRKHQVQYLRPAFLDDELEVSTWASQVRRSTALRHYTIMRVSDGALLAQAHSLGVWVDLKEGRPIRIPDGFMADFAPNLV